MALNGEIAFIVYLEPREVQPENYPYLVNDFRLDHYSKCILMFHYTKLILATGKAV
jgi:TATA-box binding protein (TBP) (component of TFIID and TFIIIB)